MEERGWGGGLVLTSASRCPSQNGHCSADGHVLPVLASLKAKDLTPWPERVAGRCSGWWG